MILNWENITMKIKSSGLNFIIIPKFPCYTTSTQNGGILRDRTGSMYLKAKSNNPERLFFCLTAIIFCVSFGWMCNHRTAKLLPIKIQRVLKYQSNKLLTIILFFCGCVIEICLILCKGSVYIDIKNPISVLIHWYFQLNDINRHNQRTWARPAYCIQAWQWVHILHESM